MQHCKSFSDTTLVKDYHEMLLKQRNISYSPVIDKSTLIEIDIVCGNYKCKELVTANMFLRMHTIMVYKVMCCCNILIFKLFYNYNNFADITLKKDCKKLLLLKMDSKCENDDINAFF